MKNVKNAAWIQLNTQLKIAVDFECMNRPYIKKNHGAINTYAKVICIFLFIYFCKWIVYYIQNGLVSNKGKKEYGKCVIYSNDIKATTWHVI